MHFLKDVFVSVNHARRSAYPWQCDFMCHLYLIKHTHTSMYCPINFSRVSKK